MSDNIQPQPLPTRSKEEILAEVQTFASQRAAERAERRARFAQVQPMPKLCIVAWVDLLGFREQICGADTPEKFQEAYRRMRDLHEEFHKAEASPHPDQQEMNDSAGKRIIALSDGLVIALNLEDDHPSAKFDTLYDRVGWFLEDLRLAQARCASIGNFVRGGVAVGYFWFEDDILLSPALVAAYQMESSLARNPVIILKREVAEGLRAMRTGAGYAEDFDPMSNLFRECEWMEEEVRSNYLMLDFMPIFLDDDDPLPFLQRYYQRLIRARAAAPERARPKYDWLVAYTREFVARDLPTLEPSVFEN